jgi:fructose-1,6-bisphosphatase I / sedoheptulose-1,7-bisphosphatase
MKSGKTLTRYLIEQKPHNPRVDDALVSLIDDISIACKMIASTVAKGSIGGYLGDLDLMNVQGEKQKKLDLAANQLLIDWTRGAESLAALVSEEMQDVFETDAEGVRRGEYLLIFDPLDGSSNIDVNISVGTIFSILRRASDGERAGVAEFLQPGNRQICAGYAVYGPSTMLVITVGAGTHGFTLDPACGEFIYTHPNMRIQEDTHEFAINSSNQRFWEEPVRRYVSELLEGEAGPRGKNFNMRWIASMVAEVHRILTRGGIFMYPRDTKDPQKPGRLRLLYEANPMAFIVEQAGGAASTGRGRLLDCVPRALHERAPVVLGSRNEVERVIRYHLEPAAEPYRSPLFNTRNLFTQ